MTAVTQDALEPQFQGSYREATSDECSKLIQLMTGYEPVIHSLEQIPNGTPFRKIAPNYFDPFPLRLVK